MKRAKTKLGTAVLCLVLGTGSEGCDTESDPSGCSPDVPSAWACGLELAVTETARDCSGPFYESEAVMSATLLDGEVELDAAWLVFSSSQDVCARRRSSDSSASEIRLTESLGVNVAGA